jgi:hypothetical protein
VVWEGFHLPPAGFPAVIRVIGQVEYSKTEPFLSPRELFIFPDFVQFKLEVYGIHASGDKLSDQSFLL